MVNKLIINNRVPTLYRMKVDPVEAEQWWGQWDQDKGKNPVCTCNGAYHLHTEMGLSPISPGDWLIKNLGGTTFRSFTVVKWDHFSDAYEPFTEEIKPQYEDDYKDDYVSFNRREHTCSIKGREVELTRIEWIMLDYFLSHRGAALSCMAILAHVWGPQYDSVDLVKWHLSNLRKKLKSASRDESELLEDATPIKTVRGFGYRWLWAGVSQEAG